MNKNICYKKCFLLNKINKYIEQEELYKKNYMLLYKNNISNLTLSIYDNNIYKLELLKKDINFEKIILNKNDLIKIKKIDFELNQIILQLNKKKLNFIK